jgi:hypothetical protein
MSEKYEYKLVRLGHGLLWPKSEAETYKEIVHQHAKEGWRLVQVFAPSRTIFGLANFHKLIFERKININ